ncbi:hypothetical protein R5R35_004547 [Gryllus longicercus]|uniref:Afadin-and alpha-actinin-binding protein n=1 Tax=Gryllus longicercus TaxID=2509291 RepID=A0AAN9W098_9ORTH
MSDKSNKFINESCSLENILTSIGDLFEELELYGVPSLPDIKETDSLCLKETTVLLKSLVNASYHMLYRHRKVLREFEELEMKRMRDMDDNRALKSTVERLKRDISDKDRALLKKEEEGNRLMEKCTKTQQELKVQSDEARQLKCQIKYIEKKNTHDIRKKEQEINKLQIQLEQAAGSRSASKSRQLATSKEIKASKMPAETEETYQQIICKFEANNKDLMLENEVLNRAFHKLNNDLALLVSDFGSILVLLPEENKDVEKTAEKQIDVQEELIKNTQDLSLEECIASSNNHVVLLNTYVDNLKQRFI